MIKKNNKRKQKLEESIGHSSNRARTEESKIHKQKSHRRHKSDIKYHLGGTH